MFVAERVKTIYTYTRLAYEISSFVHFRHGSGCFHWFAPSVPFVTAIADYVIGSPCWIWTLMSYLRVSWYAGPGNHQVTQLWLGSSLTGNTMTSSHGNIFRVAGPLWGESTGHRGVPLTKASDSELWCFLWSAPEQTVEQIIETLVMCVHYDVTLMCDWGPVSKGMMEGNGDTLIKVNT